MWRLIRRHYEPRDAVAASPFRRAVAFRFLFDYNLMFGVGDLRIYGAGPGPANQDA